MTVRAKFRCSNVKLSTMAPTQVQTFNRQTGVIEPTGRTTWPRTYEFSAVYDTSTPENERYAQATPFGQLTMQVDNPDVTFEPGQEYYLDFNPVQPAESGEPA